MTDYDETIRAQMACEHPEFAASVAVSRLIDVEGGPVTGYSADVCVKCAQCGLVFSFVGVPRGFARSHPTVSVDATELRAPLVPGGDPPRSAPTVLQ